MSEPKWLPMDDAPRDGTTIIALFDDDECLINWAEDRQCAGAVDGHGYYGPGWNFPDVGLICFDEPFAWRPNGYCHACGGSRKIFVTDDILGATWRDECLACNGTGHVATECPSADRMHV
jgi:hypothetical protein